MAINYSYTGPGAIAQGMAILNFLNGKGFDPVGAYKQYALGISPNASSTSSGSTSRTTSTPSVTSPVNTTPHSASDLVKMGYYGYQGWNDAAALQDFQKTGGAGKGGPTGGTSTGGTGSPLQDVNNLLQNSFQNLADETSKRFKEYQTGHPFSLDQVLADSLKQAKEQVDPYYNETLNNYLTGVTRRLARSKEDTSNLLGELNANTQSFSRDTQLKLNNALENANQGYADSGLLGSGAALRGTGMIGVNSQNSLEDYLRGQQYKENQANLQNTRNIEDINLESTQKQRDIGREQYTAEQTRSNQLAQESGQSYVRGFQQTLPPQLQANTGFDLLKQLGIPG